MIKRFISALLLVVSFQSQAAIINTGQLSYDDTTGIITNTTTNVRYLGWDILTGLTYAQTLTALSTTYTGFHIASQTEAYEFFNAAHFGGPQFVDTAADDSYVTSGFGTGTRFGDNDIPEADLVTFLSDTSTFELGAIAITHPPHGSTPSGSSQIIDAAIDIDIFDLIALDADPVSFLVVDDSQRIPSPVPVPPALLLFAPALIGFFGLRRKVRP